MTNTILLVTGTKSWLLVCNTYLSLGNVLYYRRTIVQQCDGTVDGQRYSIGDCTAWSFHLTIMLLSNNTFSLGHLLSYDCTTMRRKFLHYVHLSTNWNSIYLQYDCDWWKDDQKVGISALRRKGSRCPRPYIYLLCRNYYTMSSKHLWSTTLHSIKIGIHITKQEFKNDVFKAFDFSTTLI